MMRLLTVSPLRRRFLLGLTALALLAAPLELLARAGGGGGYGGGGGGFSGGGGGFGGGSFGGGGGSINIGTGSGEMHPVVFLLLVGVFIIGSAIEAHNKQQRRRKFSVDVSDYSLLNSSHISPTDEQRAATTLQLSDPQFDPQAFIKRFTSAFHQIQDAWSQQNIESVRAFVSDGVFERFFLQILEQRDMGYRDHMEGVLVERAALAEAASSGIFDVLTIKVAATAIDYRVSIDAGKYISGDKTRHGFTEFWSFVRRTGAQTHADRPGLIEGNCPNCGASIALNRSGRCDACQSLLRSGDHDWVLAEITQACEWKRGSHAGSPSAQFYRDSRDPAFNIQHLEDRASVIFWRKAMADRLGDVKPILKMATTELCNAYATEYQRAATHASRNYLGGCSVGSVDLLGMVAGDAFDHALVEIRWSATTHRVSRDGVVTDQGGWRRFRSLFVLARKPGLQSVAGSAISSAHCPGCGAPESALASHSCEYCGAVLNTGDHDWTLTEAAYMNAPSAQAWLGRLNQSGPFPAAIARPASSSLPIPPPISAHASTAQRIAGSQTDALAWMINTLAADGEFHADEKAAIMEIAHKAGIPEATIDGLIQTALQGELDAPSPPDRQSARAWLELMADVALADGKVERAEEAALARLGAHMGYLHADINMLINKRRMRLLRLAKQGGQG